MSSSVFLLVTLGNDSPTNQSEISFDLSANSNLVVDVGADVLCELNSSHVLIQGQVKKLTSLTVITVPPQLVLEMFIKRISPSLM